MLFSPHQQSPWGDPTAAVGLPQRPPQHVYCEASSSSMLHDTELDLSDDCEWETNLGQKRSRDGYDDVEEIQSAKEVSPEKRQRAVSDLPRKIISPEAQQYQTQPQLAQGHAQSAEQVYSVHPTPSPSESLNPFANISISGPSATNGFYSHSAPQQHQYLPLPTPANSPDHLQPPNAQQASMMEF